MPLKTLAVWCKSLATMLHSGVALLKALDVLARRTGSSACRRRLEAVRADVEQGADIHQALRQQGKYFPDLTVDMVSVGEQTGTLPEVLDRLAGHYENLIRMRRMLMALIAWPSIQLVAAILIIAAMIFILGIIGESRGPGSKPPDILGWGLTGTSGAIRWLVMSFGSIAAVIAGYHLIAHTFRQQRALDGLLLRIPVLGGCLRAFSIARFSWAFALTQQSGMPIGKSLVSSFNATANGAFAAAGPEVEQSVMQGEELNMALAQSGLFPEEYLHIVQVAEASGTVPETLERLSPQFEEQARRSLVVLASALGWLVWLVVAGLIIFMIFSLFLNYVGMINAAAGGRF
jgi:type IV pilus assembly protein PilC